MAIDEEYDSFLRCERRPGNAPGPVRAAYGSLPAIQCFRLYDGVPDASVAINSAALHLLLSGADAGTYSGTATSRPRALQMGMVGQLYVRHGRIGPLAPFTPRSSNSSWIRARDAIQRHPLQQPIAGSDTSAPGCPSYAYNDGDGTNRYDVEYPLQIHGFDPNFHFVGMT